MYKLPAVILAGGTGRRFGGPKGLAKLGSRAIIARIMLSLMAQTKGAVAINASKDGPYAALGLEMIPDETAAGEGPLAGLLATLDWAAAKGVEQVATVSVDVPFLPEDFLEKLSAAGAPAVAMSGDRLHPVCGIWPVSARARLAELVAGDKRAAMAWVEAVRAQSVDFPHQGEVDPFMNINTPEDLARAEVLLAR